MARDFLKVQRRLGEKMTEFSYFDPLKMQPVCKSKPRECACSPIAGLMGGRGGRRPRASTTWGASSFLIHKNPIRTLGYYSRPSHESYRNTIEFLDGNNVAPLRSDTIRLVQNGCSFHGLRPEDPNQHLKNFLKLVDSLDLDIANRLSKFDADFKQQQGEMTNKIETANAVIDYRKAKISVGKRVTRLIFGVKIDLGEEEDFTDYHLPGEREIARDVELNPFKDALVFRRMVEFL
nr:MAK10-like protein [Tanacetum cinerariifolium]